MQKDQREKSREKTDLVLVATLKSVEQRVERAVSETVKDGMCGGNLLNKLLLCPALQLTCADWLPFSESKSGLNLTIC